jgi:predicted nucleotidyltransferase
VKNNGLSMIEDILDTKTKIKIAKLFVETSESFQVSDVAKKLKISKSRASECLRELAQKGVLNSKVVGKSVVYSLSKSNLAKIVSAALIPEKKLLEKIEKVVLSEIRKFKPVSFALFGSALRGLKIDSDLDFILLYEDNIKKEEIYEISSKLTERLGFNISILTMKTEEFRIKARKGEEFIINVLANHKLLYGKELEDVVWHGKLEKKKQ